MSFSFAPAARERVGLLIGLAGASGSGKTLSALKLARGLAGGDDSRIAFIDTEAGRALHYAPAKGEKPGPDRFGFKHGDLKPPFSPDAYRDAIEAADAQGFEVIVIDSFTHEFEGDGGLHDIHDAIVDAQVEQARKSHNGSWAFDEARTRDRLSVGGWREPKMRHKRLVSRLLQSRAHLIICMRADEKIRMEQIEDDRGRKKTVIIQPKDLPVEERWVPICERRFPYELTLSAILTPTHPGVPIPIKLQAQHRDAVPLDRPLSEETGRALAAWARGETPGGSAIAAGGERAASAPDAVDAAEAARLLALATEGADAAERGTAVLQAFWGRLTKPEKHALQDNLAGWKAKAAEIDALPTEDEFNAADR